jgi:hypothetical protein
MKTETSFDFTSMQLAAALHVARADQFDKCCNEELPMASSMHVTSAKDLI